jgi:hypothetical protein
MIVAASYSLRAACESSRFGEDSLSRVLSAGDRGVVRGSTYAFANPGDTPIPGL